MNSLDTQYLSLLFSAFPNLKRTGFTATSCKTTQYNCIAWAVEDNSRFWWPDEDGYWPEGLEKKNTVDTFLKMFGTFGYSISDNPDLETGFGKIALFVESGKPTHASRQLDNGNWTSKLGREIDIEHVFAGLDGSKYGNVEKILKRPKQK